MFTEEEVREIVQEAQGRTLVAGTRLFGSITSLATKYPDISITEGCELKYDRRVGHDKEDEHYVIEGEAAPIDVMAIIQQAKDEEKTILAGTDVYLQLTELFMDGTVQPGTVKVERVPEIKSYKLI